MYEILLVALLFIIWVLAIVFLEYKKRHDIQALRERTRINQATIFIAAIARACEEECPNIKEKCIKELTEKIQEMMIRGEKIDLIKIFTEYRDKYCKTETKEG